MLKLIDLWDHVKNVQPTNLPSQWNNALTIEMKILKLAGIEDELELRILQLAGIEHHKSELETKASN